MNIELSEHICKILDVCYYLKFLDDTFFAMRLIFFISWVGKLHLHIMPLLVGAQGKSYNTSRIISILSHSTHAIP